MDNVNEILDSILLYKSAVGNFDEIGRRFSFNDYDLKIYRKKANVLRVEVKLKRKRFFKSNGIYLNTLDELLYEDVQIALRNLLIKIFEGVTIVYLNDEEIKRLNNADTLKYLRYSNPIYWTKLQRQDKRKFRRERSNCQKFIESVGSIDMKAVLLDKIKNKSAELLNFSELNIQNIMSKYKKTQNSKSVALSYIDNRIHSDSFNYSNIWTLNVKNTANNNVIKIPLLYNLENMVKESRVKTIAI